MDIEAQNLTNQQQGTENWLQWRAEGVGASDVASILGISPYGTALKLWKEKRLWIEERQLVEHDSNWAMERGTRNEPRARAHVELITAKEWPADLVVDPVKPYMRVSLDGRSGDEIMEIKVPSEKLVLEIEAKGVDAVPPHYMAQMQYQLRVTGATRCLFVCYSPESNKLVNCWVPRDETRIAEIEKAVDEFWGCVLEGVEPGTRRVDDAYLALAKEYKEVVSTLKYLEEKQEKLKKGLLEYVKTGKQLEAGGLKITPYEVKGAVDYAKIPALNGVDLEPYRKPGRIQHRILVEK